jgi:hypothetical protein
MTDVDDEELGALFRAAASDSAAPSPGFDHQAVVTASRRVTARRRAALTGGAIVLFAVVGVGAAVALPGSTGGGDTSTAAAPMLAPEHAQPDARQGAGPPDAAEGAPGAVDVPESSAAGGPPLGPGTTECADRQDPALRGLVEQVLPEVVGAPEGATTMECRPGGERGVNVEVRDGGAAGLLTVQYLPPGTVVSLAEGALSAPTASGGTVVVSSRADEAGAPAPLESRLQDAVSFLAPRL